MGNKIFSIPIKARSAKSDYACADGEIAGAVNFHFQNGALISSSEEAVNRLPSLADSPFIDGELQRPPLPQVEFSLLRSVVEGWHIHPDMLPSKIADAPAMGKGETPGEKDWGVRAMETLADFETAAKRQNLFTKPFFVMCAYRLKDSSHICPSPPILMIPNSGAPMIAGSADYDVATMQMSVVAAACRLQWRVKIPEIPLKWNGVITHLDIFVSEPISLYDSKEAPKGFHRVKCENFSHSVDSYGAAGEHVINSDVMAQAWQPSAIDEAIISNIIINNASFRQICEVPMPQISTMTNFEDVKINRGGLSILTSMESYSPDFAHLSDVSAEGHTLFSGRITAWNLKLVSPSPLPLSLVSPYSGVSVDAPRWLFHTNPYTDTYTYTVGNVKYSLPLRSHPKMRGSFYWRGFAPSVSTDAEAIDGEGDSAVREVLSLPGAVWRSDKGCRRLFPDNLLMRLDVGKVIAVCRAFRASGLVATTAPTAYAFTSDGVFLLKEMDDATFRDAGLICGYRLRDSSSLELLPTGVRFVTDNGEVVTLEGTKVTLSEDVETLSEKDELWKDFIPVEWNFDGEDYEGNTDRGVLVTRPLKLSNAEGKKSLRSLSLRGTCLPESVEVAIYGSNDLSGWRRIALSHHAPISGLWAPSCRFFRVAIMLPLQSETCLDGIAIKVATQ